MDPWSFQTPDKLRTPVEALDRAISRGGWPSMVSSRRFKKYQGRPGEIIEKMDEETRALLRELRSDDLSPEKSSRYAAWLGQLPEDDYARQFSEMLLKHDREFLRLPAPRVRKTRFPWD